MRHGAVALIGSHRTGKSTLAKAYAEKVKIPFVETSVGKIYSELGYDPSLTYDFVTRLGIQEEILKRVDQIYAKYAGEGFITDRSPLDMAAYTLADAIGDRVPAESHERLLKYVNDCFAVTNKRFQMILLIQPGIPLVFEKNKAALNESYIEHLNSLMLGLSVDERLDVAHFYMPRVLTDLDDRVLALEASINSKMQRTQSELVELKNAGLISIH